MFADKNLMMRACPADQERPPNGTVSGKYMTASNSWL
jgi:hypothetical protein